MSRLAMNRPEVRFCIASQALLLAATAPFYSGFGLRIAWSTALSQALVIALLVAVRLAFWHRPGPPHERIVADTVLAALLLMTVATIASPAQYLAVATRQPLIDPYLAAADAQLGVHVPALAAWTRAHPAVSAVLTLAYFSLLPQFVGAILLLGLVYRNAARLWEYSFHFHFCAVVTVASLAVFPAACAFSYYGFESTLPQGRFLAHFNGVRAGTLSVIRFDDLEGLISMPSFHAAGGFMLTWAFRGYRIVWLFAVLNGLLTASTVLSGAHYAVDVPGTALLFGASLLAYRLFVRWTATPASRGPGVEPS
jgi:hypothetical protein